MSATYVPSSIEFRQHCLWMDAYYGALGVK